MENVHDLVEQARRVGRIPSRREALRWMRAVVSTLSDWGGDRAKAILRAELPRELFKGAGSSGRSLARATEGNGPGPLALMDEVGLRARQPDPGKVGSTLEPLLKLVKSQLSPARADELWADLPAAVGRAWHEAEGSPPWAFRLIPQSYRGGTGPDRDRRFTSEEEAPAAP